MKIVHDWIEKKLIYLHSDTYSAACASIIAPLLSYWSLGERAIEQRGKEVVAL